MGRGGVEEGEFRPKRVTENAVSQHADGHLKNVQGVDSTNTPKAARVAAPPSRIRSASVMRSWSEFRGLSWIGRSIQNACVFLKRRFLGGLASSI